jgi:ribosomal protein L7Ae/L30e/S12e/gadd45
MINKEKALNLLGLAMKAGKLKTGEGATLDAIRSTRAKLVIMASDASPNTQKIFNDKCESYDVPLFSGFTQEEISRAIGKNRTNCALIDSGFVKSFNQLTER